MENNNTQRFSKAAAEYQRRKQKNKTMRTVAIVAAIVIVVALIAASYFTSGTWYRTRTIMNVGDHEISCAEFNYFYHTNVNNTYQTFYDSYGSAASILLDLSKPLSEQEFSEGVTWDDRFKEMTVDSIKEVYALFDKASSEGYMLTNDELANVSLSTAGIEQLAASYNLTAAQYIEAAYGKGVNSKVYADCVFKTATAAGYANAMTSDFSYTQSDLDAYYAEHISDFDTINLRIFAISGAETSGTREFAEKQANEMLEQITDEDSFAKLAYQYAADTDKEAYKDQDSTYHASVSSANLTCDGMVEWFYDDARQYGDTNVFSDENGFYVVMYISREDNNYFLRTMRHILVRFVADEEGNVSKENSESAKALAEQYLSEWNDSDKTEPTFAEMASNYSNDTGSKGSGGLIDDIAKGSLVDPIDQWIFDESRQTGDVELIESDYGWHIVYYVGETETNSRDTAIESAIRQADSENWYNSIVNAVSSSVVESVYNSKMVG